MKKPCNHPGCAVLLDSGTYCANHKTSAPKRHALYDKHVRRRDSSLALAARIRSSPRWQRVRRTVLADNPICADPFGIHADSGAPRSSTQVHHIQGLAEHPELAYTASNLQSLCTSCHARLEREHRKSATVDPDRCSCKADPTQPPGGEGQKFRPFG